MRTLVGLVLSVAGTLVICLGMAISIHGEEPWSGTIYSFIGGLMLGTGMYRYFVRRL